jgi:hypothetical protein
MMSLTELEMAIGSVKHTEDKMSTLEAGGVRLIGSEPDYDAILSWLEYCSANHGKCTEECSSSLQSIRLIDIQIRRLVPYPSTHNPSVEYLALSYVWGGFEQLSNLVCTISATYRHHYPELLVIA